MLLTVFENGGDVVEGLLDFGSEVGGHLSGKW